jgi:hypothetical protein
MADHGKRMTTSGFKGSVGKITKVIVPNKPQEGAIKARIAANGQNQTPSVTKGLPATPRGTDKPQGGIAPLTGMGGKAGKGSLGGLTKGSSTALAKGGMGGSARGATKRLGS